MELVMVRTTVGTEAQATELARRLVEGRRAACAQVVQVRSAYVWQGALNQEAEWRIEATAPATHAQALRDELRRLHPYEVPAIEAWPVQANSEYVAWAQAAVGRRN